MGEDCVVYIYTSKPVISQYFLSGTREGGAIVLLSNNNNNNKEKQRLISKSSK